MDAEQLAAIALLGMHKAPSPPPSDTIATEAAGSRKKRKNSRSSDAASSLLPTASKKQRNSASKGSSKKKQRSRGISRPPLPLKGKNKIQPAKALTTKPMSPVDRSPQKEAPCISPEQQHPGFALPKNIKTMTFNEKLHHLLGQQEFHDSIAWVPHGRAFRVLDPKLLEERKVLQTYFGCSNYGEFAKELLHHGLKKAKHGNDENAYYHEYFLRGMPHLVKQMTQTQQGHRFVDSPSSVPTLPTITIAVVPKKEPALTTNVTSNQEALLKDLLLKQQQQQKPAPSFAQLAAPPSNGMLTSTKEQEAMQYLLAIASSARAQAPAPQPPADNSVLFLQNAVANLLGQHDNNNNVPISTNSASAQLAFLQQQYGGDLGIDMLFNQQKKAAQTSYQQPQASAGASFWGQQQQQQDQTALLASLLGLPIRNNAPATSPMLSAQQGHALNALNLHLQTLQQPPRQEPKTPDLESAILSLLLQNQI